MVAAWMGIGGWVTSTVVFVIGVALKVYPNRLLNVPRVGWRLWALATGQEPLQSLYLSAIYDDDEFPSWTQAGDLFVATGTKAGTTWMCYCTHAIRTRGLDVGLPFTDVMLTTPWMELRQVPEIDWQSAKDLWNSTILPDGQRLKDFWDNEAFAFRIFKSHLTPRPASGPVVWHQVLPVRQFPKVKFLAMVRNGAEVVMSLHEHRLKLTDEFRAYHGGFPPKPMDFEHTARALLPGGSSYGNYFGYVKAWWPLRDEPNVLLMHYSDAVRDVDSTVRKLAAFLAEELGEEAIARIVTKCGFDHMKQRSHYFDYKLPFTPGLSKIFDNGGLVNKGKRRRVHMSPELQADWDAAVLAEFPDPTLRRWAAEGGTW